MLRTILKMWVILLIAGSWSAHAQHDRLIQFDEQKVARAQAALKRDEVCTKCHDESENAPILSIYQTKHGVRGDVRTPTCQSCHGNSDNHLKGASSSSQTRPAPDVVFKKGAYAASNESDRAGQCLTCHRDTKRHNWDGGAHQVNGVACNSCHQVHKPQDKVLSKKTQPEVCYTCHKEQRADARKISHHPINEGKVVCSDCHNPHGSTSQKLLKKNTINETCQNCHAEKRGPMLFEHQPVTEACTHCHTPHGSNINALLKSRPPFLCRECHDGTHGSAGPVGRNAAGIQGGLTKSSGPSATEVGRGCTNCHVQVHGSNSPAGGFLQR